MKPYPFTYLDDETVCKHINLQVLASVAPKRITHPTPWYPRNQIDKFIARNLVKHMDIATALKTFPTMTIDLSDRVRGVGEVI